MSVFKKKNSPYYYYEFQRQGVRFSGTTKQKSRRGAEAFEKTRVVQAESELEQHLHAKTSKEITINEAAARFYQEKGKFEGAHEATFSRLANLVRVLGPAIKLSEIDTEKLVEFVSIRRGEPTKNKTLPANATVNRDIETYRRLRNWAKRVWKMKTGEDPDYSFVLLPESDGRTRELSIDEENRFFEALRDDSKPLIEFLLLTGLRRNNGILLLKSQVNWTERIITVRQKSKRPGGKILTVAMTNRIAELVRSQWLHHDKYVWTYIANRNTRTAIKGERYPITVEGFKSIIGRTIERSGLEDFRVHDLRHTFASRLTRVNKSLEVTKEALGHSDIAITSRYTHATREDVRNAMEQAESIYAGHNSSKKSSNS